MKHRPKLTRKARKRISNLKARLRNQKTPAMTFAWPVFLCRKQKVFVASLAHLFFLGLTQERRWSEVEIRHM
jgi:hypothetical protein